MNLHANEGILTNDGTEKEKIQCQQEIEQDPWVRVPKQAKRRVIAVMQSSPTRLTTTVAVASGAALAVEETRDRDAGWGAGAGLAQPQSMTSVSVPAAGTRLLTLPGNHVHDRFARAAIPA